MYSNFCQFEKWVQVTENRQSTRILWSWMVFSTIDTYYFPFFNFQTTIWLIYSLLFRLVYFLSNFRTLSWHLHPPTYLSFIREMLLLLQQTKCGHSDYHEIVEISRFLTELAVCDYFFVTRKPSSVALACILNALGCINDGIKRDTIYTLNLSKLYEM